MPKSASSMAGTTRAWAASQQRVEDVLLELIRAVGAQRTELESLQKLAQEHEPLQHPAHRDSVYSASSKEHEPQLGALRDIAERAYSKEHEPLQLRARGDSVGSASSNAGSASSKQDQTLQLRARRDSAGSASSKEHEHSSFGSEVSKPPASGAVSAVVLVGEIVDPTEVPRSKPSKERLGFLVLSDNWPSAILPRGRQGRMTSDSSAACCSEGDEDSEDEGDEDESCNEEVRPVQTFFMRSFPNGSWSTQRKTTRSRPGTSAKPLGHGHDKVFLGPLREPESWFNVFMEMFGVLVLLYELTTVPLFLAWEIDGGDGLAVLHKTSMVFWTLDLVLNFLRGYHVDGLLITDLVLVARRYMRGWFLTDAFIVVSEWVSYVISKNSGSKNGMGFLRFFRLTRLLHLMGALRIIRLARIFEGMVDRSISESYRIVLRVTYRLLAVLWVNHMLCCAWHAIGASAPTSTGARWSDRVWSDSGPSGSQFSYKESPVDYQYATAMHWAVAQTTLGAMDVNPANSYERLFSIVCLLFGVFFFAVTISKLTSGMVELTLRTSHTTRQIGTLRRFLVENLVDSSIALQVQRQVEERMSARDRLIEKDVEVLQIVSVSLRKELHAELCKPALVRHPLFRIWDRTDSAWLKEFSFAAVEMLFVRQCDDVFRSGGEGTAAYYLTFGSVEYVQHPTFARVDAETRTSVNVNTFMAEAVLWSKWTHTGTAEAVSQCSLLTIHPDKMWDVLNSQHTIRQVAMEYRTCYYKRITKGAPPLSEWPTDLRVAGTEFGELAWSMRPEAQRHIGRIALRSLKTRGMSKKHAESPESEVLDGRCVLILNGRGRCERIVSLVVLKLEDAKGRIFAQVASVEKGEIEVGCKLPGVKQSNGELAHDTLERFVSTKLKPLQGRIAITSVEEEVKASSSKAYGVPTEYRRKVCRSRLTHDFVAPVCTCAYDVAGPTWTGTAATRGRASGRVSVEFTGADVYVFECGGKAVLLTWLAPEEIEYFGSSHGEKDLKLWIDSLSLPPLDVDGAKQDGGKMDDSACDMVTQI